VEKKEEGSSNKRREEIQSTKATVVRELKKRNENVERQERRAERKRWQQTFESRCIDGQREESAVNRYKKFKNYLLREIRKDNESFYAERRKRRVELLKGKVGVQVRRFCTKWINRRATVARGDTARKKISLGTTSEEAKTQKGEEIIHNMSFGPTGSSLEEIA